MCRRGGRRRRSRGPRRKRGRWWRLVAAKRADRRRGRRLRPFPAVAFVVATVAPVAVIVYDLGLL